MATASRLMIQVLRTGAPNVCPTLILNPGLNDKVRDHDNKTDSVEEEKIHNKLQPVLKIIGYMTL